MGDLATEQVSQCRPFQYLSLDIMGPFTVKGLGGFSRKTFKVWAIVLVCLASKAVSSWALKDYGTDAFLMAFMNHVSVYGPPSLVITDRGSQIRAAADVSPNWDSIQHETASRGTAWRFVPAATPWRNGLSERIIGLMKRSLVRQVNSGALIDFAQLEALLLRVAALMNSRPLSARSFTEEDFMAIMPRDLLLGASPGGPGEGFAEQERMDEQDHRLARMVKGVEEKVKLWWTHFFHDVFPLLIPRRAMMERQANLQVGDIVLVRYVSKFGRDAFRLARIVRVHPDKHGAVRTVTVWLRNRAKAPRERAEACRQGVTELKTPVQRLVLILPAEDQPMEVLDKLRSEAGADQAVVSPSSPLHTSPAPCPGSPQHTSPAPASPGQEVVPPPLPQRLGGRARAAQSRELALSRNLSPARPGGRKMRRL